MMRTTEEDCLHTGAAVLPRGAHVSTERFTAVNRQLRQLTPKYPGPQENKEFSGILGLRFPGAKHSTTTRRRDTPATQCVSAPGTTMDLR